MVRVMLTKTFKLATTEGSLGATGVAVSLKRLSAELASNTMSCCFIACFSGRITKETSN